MSIVYLNGEYLDKKEARISPLDRGFIFGDGVYEVLPVFNNQIFRLTEHLNRLDKSLDSIHIRNPYNQQQWDEILTTLVKKNPGKNQSVYLQITRGVAERDHIFDDNMQPTVFIMSRQLSDSRNVQGIAAITEEDIRWKYCNIKSIALLPGVLLRYEAYKQGAKEAILIRDGYVTEGAASNVFIIKDEVMFTPTKNIKILAGVTRDLVVELARNNNIECVEKEISEEDLTLADEIWVTSSTQEIVPVIKLDSKIIGNGKPGAMWHKMNHIYQTFKNEFCG